MDFRVSHFGICVTDLARSVAFYSALGFAEAEGFELRKGKDTPIDRLLRMEGIHLHGRFMRRTDGVALELLQFDSPVAGHCQGRPAMNEPGLLTHLSLLVEDLEEAAEALEAAGGRCFGETRTYFEDSGVHAVFCSDPDGLRIELMQRTQ